MISLELVPRSIEGIVTEAQQAVKQFDQIDFINIPDVLRLPTRSWDATSALLDVNIQAIPHIRAMDHTLDGLVNILSPLLSKGLQKIIIISGDVPKETQKFSPSGQTPISLSKGLKKALPQLEVYGALDPYRNSMKKELAYAQEKMEAGMVGLFSQPFFDVRLLDIYLDQLKGIPFFAGLSPVTSDKSMSYWEDVNQVVFPENFRPTLSYNVKLSQDCLESAKVKNQNAYLMPIRIKAQEYLSALWEPENTTYST